MEMKMRYDRYDHTPPKRAPPEPKNETLDRISDLPDSLLLHILSFLPMQQVIRTCTLSKRWRYVWLFIDSLIFDASYYVHTRKFVSFVDKALGLCKCSNINKFAVYLSNFFCYYSHFSHWLSFAIQNNVKHLDLNFNVDPQWRATYELPQIVNCIESLESLKLRNCFSVPSGIVNWKSLKSLTLDFVKLNNDLIGKLLSGTPVLEFLALKNFSGFNRLDITSVSLNKLILENYDCDRKDKSVLEISAPNLQSLDILGVFYRKMFRLINVSSLVDANINFTCYYGGVCTDDDHQVLNLIREVLKSLRHVKELKFGKWCLQVLAILELKGFGFSFSSCKCLTLDTEITRWEIPGISSLIRSSPNLETLIINLDYHHEIGFLSSSILDSYEFGGYEYWTSPKNSREFLLHLKAVKFVGDSETYCENKFAYVQFLLKKTRILERMDFISERLVA